MSLNKFIEQENAMNALFKRPLIKRPTNLEECKPLFTSLVGQLSPENLTCDGELSPSRVRAKHKFLMSCWGELERIAGRTVTESQAYSWYVPRPFGR